MKLRIELKSDLCSYSGETFNSFIDTDIVYEENGFPYIPAKRVKGCIRETCQELVEFGVVDQEIYNNLFGEGMENRAAVFSMDNAYLIDYDDMVEDIVQADNQVLTHPQRVLNLYTYTRTQTAMEKGIAKKDSLRTMRVVKKGLIFVADVHFNKKATPEQIDAFEKTISLVKHMGVARTRGLGQVEMTLEKDEDNKEFSFIKIQDTGAKKYRLDYGITLRAPMICKSDEGNQAVSQDYIAGNKVLGMLIGKIGQEAYKQLPEDAVLQVSNAYITDKGERCTKISKSLQKVKDSIFVSNDQKAELKVYDMTFDYKGGEQMTSAGGYYVTPDNYVQTVNMQIDYHHRRPEDKSVGRANGLDGSSFYQLESISAGQTFRGYIIADLQTANLLTNKVPKVFETRMGYGRTSEYGMADFKWISCKPLESHQDIITGKFAVKLNSPLILYNEYGCPTSAPQDVAKCLCKLLHIDNLTLESIHANYTTIGGYNVTWHARKPMFTALDAGTILNFNTNEKIDASPLNGNFVGERTREGYGEIELYQANGLETALFKHLPDKKSEKECSFKTNIVDELMQQQELLELAEAGRKLASKTIQEQKLIAKDPNKKNDVDAIISKLILMFHGEKSLKAFVCQMNSIADDKKRQKAKDVMRLGIEYISEYQGVQDADKVYKCIIDAYLSQIKYKIRPSREERRA